MAGAALFGLLGWILTEVDRSNWYECRTCGGQWKPGQATVAIVLSWLVVTGLGAGVVYALADLVARSYSKSVVARGADSLFGNRFGEPFAAGMAILWLVAMGLVLAIWIGRRIAIRHRR